VLPLGIISERYFEQAIVERRPQGRKKPCSIKKAAFWAAFLMGDTGLEPVTSCL
jgi:hypothetical protein